jgi:peroxiredoxin
MLMFRPLLASLCLLSVPCFAQHTPRKSLDTIIPTSDGKSIHMGQYKGKVMMIEFFLTDCPECLQTLQFLGKLQKELAPRGFQAVGISLDPDPSVVKPFAERYRFPFPIAHMDPPSAIKFLDLKETGHPMCPYVLFIDWQGSVRFQYPGDDPIFKSADKNLRQIAEGLLRQAAEKKGPEYQTRPAGKQ